MCKILNTCKNMIEIIYNFHISHTNHINIYHLYYHNLPPLHRNLHDQKFLVKNYSASSFLVEIGVFSCNSKEILFFRFYKKDKCNI